MKQFLAALLFLSLFSTGASAEELSIGRFCLDNPLGETSVEKLGAEAVNCMWPASAKFEDCQVQLIVVDYDPKAVEMMSESGSISKAALATYLGLYKKPEQINKTLFFGKTGARRVFQSSVPRAHEAHVYSKRLEDGSFVLVGVRYFQAPDSNSGKLLRSIGNTFRLKETE